MEFGGKKLHILNQMRKNFRNLQAPIKINALLFQNITAATINNKQNLINLLECAFSGGWAAN